VRILPIVMLVALCAAATAGAEQSKTDAVHRLEVQRLAALRNGDYAALYVLDGMVTRRRAWLADERTGVDAATRRERMRRALLDEKNEQVAYFRSRGMTEQADAAEAAARRLSQPTPAPTAIPSPPVPAEPVAADDDEADEPTEGSLYTQGFRVSKGTFSTSLRSLPHPTSPFGPSSYTPTRTVRPSSSSATPSPSFSNRPSTFGAFGSSRTTFRR